MFWRNDLIDFAINAEIVEYDIKAGNASISKEYKLLPDEITDSWLAMDGYQRKVACGNMQREDQEYAMKLEASFNNAVDKFIALNNLDRDSDIIAIKRDAVFVLNKSIKHEFIGDYVHFRPKERYHAYLYLKTKDRQEYEFYFERNGNIEIKGMNDEMKAQHENGILLLLNTLVEVCEKTSMDLKEINLFMKDCIKKYKDKDLDFPFYKSFSKFDCSYKINMDGMKIDMEEIDEDYLEYLDISYNYINILLPLQQTVC